MKTNECVIRLLVLMARCAAGVSLILLLGIPLCAQYGGMGGGMGGGATGGGTMGTSSASGPGYGANGKAIGIGVGAAVAAIGAVYLVRHHQGPVYGCVTVSPDDRLRILDEKTGQTYSLRASDVDIKAGERVELKGKRFRDENGVQGLEVKKVQDLGACH